MKKGFIYFQGMQIKANCYACKYLDYAEDASYESLDGGYFCNKREYENEKKQREFENNMQRDKYLKRSKPCCMLKYDL